MKKLFFALPLVALAACGSGDSNTAGKDVIMTADFDSLVGWIPDATVLAKDKAHSGQYSLRVDPTREFSMGYNALLGQLSTTRIRGVKMDAWTYLTDKNSAAQLVFLVKDVAGGKEILADRTDLSTQTKDYGKWVKISKEITFPASANYSSQVVIYLWRGGATTPTYIDDIQLTALH